MTTPDNERVSDSHHAPPPPDADAQPEVVRAPSSWRARRRRDYLIAAVIALVSIIVASVLYLTSDSRAVDSRTGPDYTPVDLMSDVPETVATAWEQQIPAGGMAATSSLGTVVIADAHTITGRDADTGDVRWSYGRSNRELCAVGSGDVDELDVRVPHNDGSDSDPRGFLALYSNGEFCSEMVLLDPKTGARRYQRTAPNLPNGHLIFGGPYAAWSADDRMEIWRWDLVRTLQYGNLPSPEQPGSSHLGCTFPDVAVAHDIVATVEKCGGRANLQLVLNWTDPNTHDKGDSPTKHRPLATVDLGSEVARIIGITADRVSVLVASPSLQIRVFDRAGKQTSSQELTSAVPLTTTTMTPRITLDGQQYALIDGALVSVTSKKVKVTSTVTPSSSKETPSPKATTKVKEENNPVYAWSFPGAIGVPALVGSELLVPVADGLAVVDPATGKATRTIAVSRAGNPARVDLAVIGERIIETRPTSVVALKAGS